jgi:hypothetical protein
VWKIDRVFQREAHATFTAILVLGLRKATSTGVPLAENAGRLQSTLTSLAAQADCDSQTSNVPSTNDPRPGLIVNLFIVVALAAGGIALGLWLSAIRLGNTDPRDWSNAFYVVFARNEPAGLAIVVLLAAVSGIWIKLGAPGFSCRSFLKPSLAVWLIAIVVFLLTAAGTSFVFHRYALSADENMVDFQARIFLSGKLRQEVPAFWQPMVRLITPTHAVYFPSIHSWNSGYLPVYSVFRATLMPLGLEWLTNPVFAAISVLAIAGIARRIWPDDPRKTVLAAGLLAASSQFLVMSMTAYAMPAHLALNLVWLWLYSDPAKRRFWLAPFVGVAALGLHQPFFHALFVIPFLVRLILDRRLKIGLFFALIYSIGIVCWFAWWRHFQPNFTGVGSKGTFGLYHTTATIQFMYLAFLLGWLAFPLVLLIPLGFAHIRAAPPLLRDAAASCLLTFGFYVFVRLDQAHGWGDRYFHGALGCLILVAVAGWDSLSAKLGKRSAVTFVGAGLAAALLLQLPLRCFQAEEFVRPYARAADVFHHIDADIIVFQPCMAWYSNDLLRNDPFLQQRPIIVSLLTMTAPEANLLQKAYPRARLIGQEQLKALGLETQLFQ